MRLGCARGLAARLEKAGGRVLRLGQTLEVAAWEIAHLESCHWGKYPWEVATWERFFLTSLKLA